MSKIIVTFNVEIPVEAVSHIQKSSDMHEYALRLMAQSFYDADEDIRQAMENDCWTASFTQVEDEDTDRWTLDELDHRWPTPPQTVTSGQVMAVTQRMLQMSYNPVDPVVLKYMSEALVTPIVADEEKSVADRVNELLLSKQNNPAPPSSIKFERKNKR